MAVHGGADSHGPRPPTVPGSVGIFGGTFDPIHVGHLVAATWARERLGLDRVLLVVANDPWQKAGTRTLTPAEDRLAVVEAALSEAPGLEASRLEIDRGGPSYTADTVDALRAEHPELRPHVIVGADVAADMDSWHRVGDLRERVTLVVVDRGGVASGEDPAGFDVRRVRIPALDISSSDLRHRLSQDRSVEFLVPAPAIRCIRQLNLYAGPR